MITSPTPAVVLSERPMTRMHWIERAPVLSATRRRDCGWITRPPRRPRQQRRPRPRRRRPRSAGPLDDLVQTPPLRRRQRSGLLDEDGVAGPGVVLLVMGLELRRQPDDALV